MPSALKLKVINGYQSLIQGVKQHVLQKMAAPFEPTLAKAKQSWLALTPQEQTSLRILAWFIPIALLLYGTLLCQQYASNQASKVAEEKQLSLKLAEAAPILSSTTYSDLPLPDLINQIAANSALTIQQTQIDSSTIGIATSHAQYAIIANMLTQFQQYGVELSQFELSQLDNKSITVSAVLQKSSPSKQ